MYADDVILFCSSLKQSLPALLDLLGTFGVFSGYKVNNGKSVIMFLSDRERLNPPISTPFVVSKLGFTYLGVTITPTIKGIIPANYTPLTESVSQLIDRWTELPISMIGRVNILKMTILPKFLYLFQSIPLSPPPSFFKELKKIFLNFIWNKNRPRLRFSLLHLPYERGGLQVPNLLWYFWAAQIRAGMFYFVTNHPPAWVTIESQLISIPIYLYMYSADKKKMIKQTKKPYWFGLKLWYAWGRNNSCLAFHQFLVIMIFGRAEQTQVLDSGLLKVLLRCQIFIMEVYLYHLKNLRNSCEAFFQISPDSIIYLIQAA